MENKIRRSSENIEIPESLSTVVDGAISKGDERRLKLRFIRRSGVGLAATVLIGLSAIGIGVNSSEVFADTINEIPILKSVARIMTYRSFEINNENLNAEISIPEIKGINDPVLEAKINLEIQKKLSENLEEIEIRAEEYKEAYFSTGGTKENFHPIKATVDYEVKSISENYLSFVIYQYESLGSAYTQYTFYNLDIIENREVDLEDIFGENYIDVINEKVIEGIDVMKKDPKNIFFDGDMGFLTIDSNQKFYINSDENIVMIFEKYEIAPGYMGIIEFEILK
ncbi:MAG: DUF3298 and DUF4163 domain-containing protein [Bacillota bacterium]|nr:DUF3298 and DUF4163 domain-containing protein [Bacillota bacterium]